MSDETLDYTTVRHVNLTPLREAVHQWTKLPEKFKEVHTTFDTTVSKPLTTHRSGWHGEAKDAAFKSFRGVQNQVMEAAGQARKIGTVMSEALSEIQSAKDELKSVETAVHEKPKQEGAKNYLKLNEKDGVVYVDPPEGEDSPGIQKAYHETIVTLNQRISAALKKASEADRKLKTALLIDPTGKGFNDDIAGHLRDVDKETKEDAAAALKLAEDKGSEMSEKELSRLNGILAKNAKNTDFAERFALGLGPKGALDFWYNMAKPETEQRGTTSVTLDRTKAEIARRAALQDNLGVTLGLASNSDSPRMEAWKKDMLNMSMDRIHAEEAKGSPYADKGPYNAQVLSNLMRTGKWDKDFLHSYGDKLLEKDQEKAIHNYKNDPPSKWISGGLSDSAFLNFGPKNDAGEDPVTGFMEALGHNPEASTGFFKDKENFDYLLRERDWPEDGEVADEGKLKDVKGGSQALAHALTSATTGHNWESPLPLNPSHTKDEAEVMSQLIKGVASEDDHIKLVPGMHEPLGRAAAEYTPDLFRALHDGSGDSQLFPMSGHQAEVDHLDATKFLLGIGQDPDANAYLSQSQKKFAAEAMDHALASDLPADQKYDASPKETVQQILRTSGEMSGTLTIGRQEAVISEAVAKDAEFEKATLSARLWGNTAFGTGLYGATAYAKWFPNPVVGAALSGLIGGSEAALANDIDAGISHNEGAEKAAYAGRLYNDARDLDIKTNEEMLKKIQEEHGIDTSMAWANTFTYEGFGLAKDSVESSAAHLSSMDQVKSLPADRPD
jgi:hypothetical protein